MKIYRTIDSITDWRSAKVYGEHNNLDIFNFLAPGRCVIFKHIIILEVLSISDAIALRWMPQGLIDDKSILI